MNGTKVVLMFWNDPTGVVWGQCPVIRLDGTPPGAPWAATPMWHALVGTGRLDGIGLGTQTCQSGRRAPTRLPRATFGPPSGGLEVLAVPSHLVSAPRDRAF